jgi:protein TonB
MKNNNILTFVSKDKGLLIGLVFSLVTHLFLFTLFPSKKDELLGDKYTPIEIIDIESQLIKGDSVIKSKKSTKKNLSDFENDFKQRSEEKLEKNIEDKNFHELKIEQKETSSEELNPQLNELVKVRKIGNEKGIKSDETEKGSIKGKGYQKVTCLSCLEPKYPKLAIKRGYEGVLKLEITILKNGKVKDVFIKESTGFEILDKAGINAAKNSKFYPLYKNTNLKIEYILKLN